MKAVQITKPGFLEVVDVPIPRPSYGEALCKVYRAGICGTDYSIYSGSFAAIEENQIKFPLQPGHEWAGEVVEVGEGVTDLKPGTRVMGDTAIACGKCKECLSGMYMQCINLRSVGTVNAWPGCFAEYVIFPVRHLFAIPDNVSYDQAALAEPAATAMYAVHHAPVKAGDRVVVLGTGAIGMLALELCRIYGASQVISVGRNDEKLAWSKRLGATHLINTLKNDTENTIFDMTQGKGVDVAIELSGAKTLFQAGLRSIRASGVLSIVAFYDSSLEINPNDIVFKNVTIRPVPGCFGMIERTLRLMETQQFHPEKIITHRCTLKELKDCLDTYKHNNGSKIKIMLQMDN